MTSTLRCVAFALALSVATCGIPVAADDATPTTESGTHLMLVVGAAGESEFGSNFVQQAEVWQKVAAQGGCQTTTFGLDSQETSGATNSTDFAKLKASLESEPRESPAELWLVFIGHGTFDGRDARFNLRGPDLTASNLTAWLKPFRRPIAVIDTASASSPFLNTLSASNRVVITATRSGFEHNYTRFGRYLAEAIADPAGDLDRDGQTSLLEAFLSASYRVADFYKTEGRMATEHALIDDNGDGLGTPSEWFRGLRAVKRPKDGAALDGLRAHQFHLVRSAEESRLTPEVRARRDALERQVSALRDTRASVGEEAYFARLETLLLDLARLYHPTPTNAPAPPAPSGPR